MEVLARKLGATATEQTKSEQPRFRIVLGLIEGYGDNNNVHTLDEVKTELGSDFVIADGEIYSAHSHNGVYSVYTGPAAIIEGNKPDILKVYTLAEKFRQERFTVDDLDNFKSHTVETTYCKSPDNEEK